MLNKKVKNPIRVKITIIQKFPFCSEKNISWRTLKQAIRETYEEEHSDDLIVEKIKIERLTKNKKDITWYSLEDLTKDKKG